MEAEEIYLRVRPEDIGYIQAIFESYEGVGIIRTVDRQKAIIALLVVEGFRQVASSILASLKREVPLTDIPRPADVGEDWLLQELFITDTARDPTPRD